MGQKIRPDSYRLGIIKNWDHRWFGRKNAGTLLEEDLLIRKTIENKIKQAGIASIEIERKGNLVKVNIKAGRPGLIIGRGGRGIEDLKKAIEKSLKKKESASGSAKSSPAVLNLNVEELKRTELSAGVIAQNIAWDLEKRYPFRRTMRQYLENIMQNREIKGAKIKIAGRLDGAEIARREWLAKGRMPLQTLRANIDYGEATAFTTYGTVGIKIWLYKGDVFVRE